MKRFRLTACLAATALFLMMAGAVGCDCGGKDKTPPAAGPVAPGHPAPGNMGKMLDMLPAGPMIALYAPDLSELADKVESSSDLGAYLASRSSERFADSRLARKLKIRIEEFLKLAGPDHDMRDALELAGGESALGLYDIGELHFVYLSRREQSAFANTFLGRAETGAIEAEHRGNPYFVLAPEASKAALYFGMAGGLVVVSNREDMFLESFGRALGLDASGGDKLGGNSDKFAKAFPADFEVNDLAMIVDQGAMNEDSYFTTYWLGGRTESLARTSTAAVSLSLSDGAWVEDRYFGMGEGPAVGGIDDIGACRAVMGLGFFGECLPVMSGTEAAGLFEEMLAGPSSLPGFVESPSSRRFPADPREEREIFDDGKAFSESLAGFLGGGSPMEAYIANRVEWSDGRMFFKNGRSLALRFDDAGDVPLGDVRLLLAERWGRLLLGDGGGNLEWTEDEHGSVCSAPLFDKAAFWLDREGDFLVLSSEGGLHEEMLAAAGSGGKAGNGTGGGPVYLSRLDGPAFSEDLRKAGDALLRSDLWTSYGAKAFLEHDLGFAADLLSGRRVLREVDNSQGYYKERLRIEPAGDR